MTVGQNSDSSVFLNFSFYGPFTDFEDFKAEGSSAVAGRGSEGRRGGPSCNVPPNRDVS